MPEPEIRQPLRPLEVETRQRTELLYFFTYQKRGALTIASDHIVVGKGNNAVRVGREGLREATYRIDGFLGHDVWFENDGNWRDLPLPFGVQQGLPVRDILGSLLIDWGLPESVPGWSKLDQCDLFPEQFKLTRWANLPHGVFISVLAIPFISGIFLAYRGQNYFAAGLIFGPLFLAFFFYIALYELFSSRIVLCRDNLILFPSESQRREIDVHQIEKLEIEVESMASRSGKKRLTLCLKNGEKVPLCNFRQEWAAAEAQLLDALRSRDIPIVVPGYE